MKPHTLVIGGTGILRDVSLHFVRQGHAVSVIARDVRRLKSLIRETLNDEGVVNMIPLDYQDTELLSQKLTESIAVLGPVHIAIGRISDKAVKVRSVIADVLGSQSNSCTFHDVLGCPVEVDIEITDSQGIFESHPQVTCQPVEIGGVGKDEVVGKVLAAISVSSAD